MASTCTFQFDNNPYGVYYAGQVISGTAELITTRPKTIRSIYITLSGFAEVRWTEDVTKQGADGKPEKAVETFSASEMYYSSEKYVYGQSGGSQLELPAGKYVFPFQGTIPPNTPTSFNGSHGQIQHEVTLVIDRVMRYNNTFKQGYSVISSFDLNLNPEHAKSLQKIEEKTFCWSLCCGTQGPMVMKINVPYSAYVPGQKLRFNVVLDNQSNVHCSDVKVRLMKKVIYTSHNPVTKTQTTEQKVADNHCGEVIKMNKAEFNEILQIPATTPSSLASCTIIKVSYTLRFIAKTPVFYSDLVVDFPFTIGTVPIYASTQDDQGPVLATQPSKTSAYKPLPPPMFEEDMRSEQFENNTFKPRYPVYISDGKYPNNASPQPPANNVYPSAKITHHTPNPVPVPIQIAPTPTGPAMPASAPMPHSATSPIPTPLPLPATVPSPANSQPTSRPATGKSGSPVEVLGFSIPPDYKPTPTAPSGNIGWN